MRDPRINFRTRELAALLAFLVPGAGHFYQGRRLKAGVYFTCILSLFFAGMVLGDWQPVYSQVVYSTQNHASLQMQTAESQINSHYSYGYAAQVLVGLPALPALLQQSRFSSNNGVEQGVESEFRSDFSGTMRHGGHFIPVTGTLELGPSDGGRGVSGEFQGETLDGRTVGGPIDGDVVLGRRVFGSPRREAHVTGFFNGDGDAQEGGPTELLGSVARPFHNWYQAPRDNAELDRLHGKLSQHFDIACVFTWIAGLLNLMAIWDAYDGPAYGYGDEEPDEDEDDDSDTAKTKSDKDS
ncbi:DUF6677 family protein [Fuerstiella marisgermanici]|uniref:DUF6677 domain-containing protein n=1 Tax=Fuerstiella marisgermanici TaxID=1891926 RepID=A0A1P8WJW0_9PLAN|nr:DUF6677 family protein [Fuerstiella marisgermanici]APZ94352.1 hypothetical protein Fuma_03980 [Fuerstiella marisgermanici]